MRQFLKLPAARACRETRNVHPHLTVGPTVRFRTSSFDAVSGPPIGKQERTSCTTLQILNGRLNSRRLAWVDGDENLDKKVSAAFRQALEHVKALEVAAEKELPTK
jgi:hypothetical protein